MTTYWAARRAAGQKIVACTVFDSTGINQTERATLNTWILAQSDKWDAVVDLAANANLSDRTNTTYFSVDQIHLTATGYGIVSGLVKTAVESL